MLPRKIPHRIGVELEFIRPSRISISKIKHIVNGWKYHYDGSVETFVRNYEGDNELVSKPITRTSIIISACKKLKKLKCRVNKSCGTHVHHDLKYVPKRLVKSVIFNSIVLYQHYQRQMNKLAKRKPIGGVCGTFNIKKRRLRTDDISVYTIRENTFFTEELTTRTINNIDFQRLFFSRYHTVNPVSYWKHKTLEFRQHKGTLNPKQIIRWANLTHNIVQRAISLSKQRILLNPSSNYKFARSYKKEFVI